MIGYAGAPLGGQVLFPAPVRPDRTTGPDLVRTGASTAIWRGRCRRSDKIVVVAPECRGRPVLDGRRFFQGEYLAHVVSGPFARSGPLGSTPAIGPIGPLPG